MYSAINAISELLCTALSSWYQSSSFTASITPSPSKPNLLSQPSYAMASTADSSSLHQSTEAANPLLKTGELQIPPQLKFMMANIKTIINDHLSADNYPLWRTQLLKLFTANGFDGFLDGTTPCPPHTVLINTGELTPNPLYALWKLIDQNLAAAIFSITSASILPYILNLNTCSEIWRALDRRLQSSNRSKVIQLKNSLHNISMKAHSMSQYLTEVKTIVDSLAAAGATTDPEDIILYILNGLPSTYQSFKTAIRTTLTPIDLDDFYSLLCNEEINLASEQAREVQGTNVIDNTAPKAFAAISQSSRPPHSQLYRGRSRRGYSTYRGRLNRGGRTPHSATSAPCQICFKMGHSALDCWHRTNPAYTSNTSPSQALLAAQSEASDTWYIDSGATSHLTANPNHLQQTQPYLGSDSIFFGNGQHSPISHIGHGILPTPGRTSRAARFLRENGIMLFKVREETVKLLGKSDMYFFSPEHPALTEPAQKALDWAVDEKVKSGVDGEITTSHMLLGIWSEKESAGHKILASLGFTDENANEVAKSANDEVIMNYR